MSPESRDLPDTTDPADSAAAQPLPQASSVRPQVSHDYQVVARRYRPQSFEALVGQEHVARALSNAIATRRVGHAYLFTGARGVGKTSAARILAKALDCVHGPTPHPCNQCDICESIAAGNDVDVLEIDGASNRGIDEIRQLRQNVGVRPSRARFKIYIIDEVHMLTREAFNALLKTLEEPPEHVKFIFCTTEAGKIPITILSRCQRFDFAGIRAPSIRERLEQIATAEGVQAEPAALELLARRANGSMRDSQSLLEQLLAFGGQEIRVADVHALLGTAGDARLVQLLRHLVHRDAAAALSDLDAALNEGVDVGQLLEQLLCLARDAMAAAVGCPPDAFLYTSPEESAAVSEAGRTLGLETILAVLQILDQTLARMRYSTQGRTLAETALVRICHLQDLETLASLLADLQSSAEPAEVGAANRPRSAAPVSRRDREEPPQVSAAPPAPSGKKKEAPASSGSGRSVENGAGHISSPHPADAVAAVAESAATSLTAGQASTGTGGRPPARAPSAPGPPASSLQAPVSDDPLPLSSQSAPEIWARVLALLPGGLLADSAASGQRIAISAPNRLVVSFPQRYNLHKSVCERPDQAAELQRVLRAVTGTQIQIEFASHVEENGGNGPASTPPAKPASNQRQWLAEKAADPFVQHAAEVLGATPFRADPPSG